MTEEELDRHIIEATSWRYETDKEALENYNKFGPWFRCDLKVTLLADAIRIIPIDKDYRTPTSIMKNLRKKDLETLQKELTEAIEERKASLSKQEALQDNDRRKEVLKCLS